MQAIPTFTLADYPADLAGSPTWRQFRAYRLEDFITDAAQAGRYSRKDFHKVTLSQGPATYYQAGRQWALATGQYALVFTNTQLPYRWDIPGLPCRGYCAVFTAGFVAARATPLTGQDVFAPGSPGFSYLTEAQYHELQPLFEQMLRVQASAYVHKYEMLFHYLMLSIHTAWELAAPAAEPAAGVARLAAAFHTLLADQFPLLAPTQRLTLRTAQDFAVQLAVHVNHLNRTLKAATGKSTSQLLAERLGQEAWALLRHTDWPISSIAACLGFEEPTHFSAFFRRYAGCSPSQARQVC